MLLGFVDYFDYVRFLAITVFNCQYFESFCFFS